MNSFLRSKTDSSKEREGPEAGQEKGGLHIDFLTGVLETQRREYGRWEGNLHPLASTHIHPLQVRFIAKSRLHWGPPKNSGRPQKMGRRMKEGKSGEPT